MPAVAAIAVLLALPAAAQIPDETPVEDVLEIVALEGRLLAIDARGGGQTSVLLEIGERVVWSRSRGKVGVALTDRRILAVTTGSASWQETRYRRTETHPKLALLGDRVALVHTSERVLGFTSVGGNLIEYQLGPNESLVDLRTGANVAAFLTSRQALGLSAKLGGFFPADLQLQERIIEFTPRANLVTVRTSRRLLIFRAPTGSWEERKLELRDSR